MLDRLELFGTPLAAAVDAAIHHPCSMTMGMAVVAILAWLTDRRWPQHHVNTGRHEIPAAMT